jgi:hypothetical protein
MPGLHICTLKE